MPLITHLTPSPRQPKRLHLRVQNKPVATLPASAVAELGLAIGREWDAALAARVAEAVEVDQALHRAAKQVDRRPRSRAQVEAKLLEWGYAPPIVAHVLQRMDALGLIDDLALGRALIDEILRKGPAGPALLRAKLEQRSLAPAIVDQLVDQTSTRPQDPSAAPEPDSHAASTSTGVAGALTLARQRLATLRHLDATTQRRRLWGLLARRGFDEDVIDSALRQIPGLPAADE